MDTIETKIENQKAHLISLKESARIEAEKLSGIYESQKEALDELLLISADVDSARLTLEQIQSTSKDELRKVENEKSFLEKEKRNLADIKEKSDRYLLELAKQKEDIRAEINSLLIQIKESTSTLNSLKEEVSDIEKIKLQKEELIGEVSRIEDKIDSLNGVVSSTLDSIKNKEAELNNTIKGKEAEIADLDKKIEIKSKALEGHGNGLREFENELKVREKNLQIYAGRLRKLFKSQGIEMPEI